MLDGAPEPVQPALVQLATDAEMSVSDHEASYGKDAPPAQVTDSSEDDAAAPAEKPRHRAKSQRATPEDVPRIAELTKKLRAAEARAQELETKYSKPAPVAEPVTPEPARVAPAVATPSATPAGKPRMETFEAQIGTKYKTYAEAVEAYSDARDDFKEQNARTQYAETQAKKAQETQAAQWQTALSAHNGRQQEFKKKQTDYDTVTAPFLATNIPVALIEAIVRDDNSAGLVYHLAQHPDDVDEMYLLSEGKPASDESVALLQRRLHKLYGQAAPTGSVAVAHPPAPKPPNPVRTGPIKTGDELPGEDHSLADHEKAWGVSGKRRR